MFIEFVSNVAIYQRLLRGKNRPDCSYIRKFGCTQPAGKPYHGTMPEEIIATYEIPIPSKMILPGLMTGQLVQITGNCINTNVKGSEFTLYHVKAPSRCKFTRSIVFIRRIFHYTPLHEDRRTR